MASEAAVRRLATDPDFQTVLDFLAESLGWPITEADAEDVAFDYTAEELGLASESRVKIRAIKQIRPLVDQQPWGVFYLDFDRQRLPVVVLRRILKALVRRERVGRSTSPTRAAWPTPDDLLFICGIGEEGDRRGVCFVHFQLRSERPPQLRALWWDDRETHLYFLREHLQKLQWPVTVSDPADWGAEWASAFKIVYGESIRTARQLSSELARLAKRTERAVLDLYHAERATGRLHELHQSFRLALVHDLDVPQFADMIAQTVAYGIFTARVTGQHVLGLEDLGAMLPSANPFLSELFRSFVAADAESHGRLEWDELEVHDLVELLNDADMGAILEDFGRQSRGGSEDPVIHFYESFLGEYDQKQKVQRGVFYTPLPVVSYMVEAVDAALVSLGLADGLADVTRWSWRGREWPKVLILDPAVGTGTFLVQVIDLIYRRMDARWREEGLSPSARVDRWQLYVEEDLLPRVAGFELMMAPYAIAHMKVGLKLKETGYHFRGGQRLQIFLTNTLEPPRDWGQLELGLDFLSREARAADLVKGQWPATVVVGNPPYSGHSENNQIRWIVEKVHDYRRDFPDLQRPAQAKWLQDDYVKFIRYGQYRIETTGHGILALITNHSYLDNPTFKGMRKALLDTFDYSGQDRGVSVMDLHGNLNKHERTPEGNPDQNIFDIQQGVAIGLFLRSEVRGPATDGDGTALRKSDLWGTREAKYSWLSTHRAAATDWRLIRATPPHWSYAEAGDVTLRREYEVGWPIPTIMGVMGPPAPGIVTTQDEFAISWTAAEARAKVEALLATHTEEEARQRWRLCSQSQWNYARAKRELATSEWREQVRPILYRPFDRRWTVYEPNVAVHRRDRVMRYLLGGGNRALVTVRQVAEGVFSHAFVADTIVESRITTSNKGIGFVFPLFLDEGPPRTGTPRRPNLAPEFVAASLEGLGLGLSTEESGDLRRDAGPADLFNYIYAVLHSTTYRQRYAPFLKMDFPRVPVTLDLALFRDLSRIGGQLVEIHLEPSSSELAEPARRSSGQGRSSVVIDGPLSGAKRGYPRFEDGLIYVDPTCAISGVSHPAYELRINGYKVAEKWLQLRARRGLVEEDLAVYVDVLGALEATVNLVGEIDALIVSRGGWPLR
ncbi:MAG: type ISP restriction/modification enzyme [Candidatus Dormibacteria bacterium]